MARLSRFVLAFAVAEYRWLWGYLVVASIGNGVRMLATGWLVLDMTNSPFWVGLAAGLQGLGVSLFGVFGGVLVDRFDKRWLLVLVEVATGVVTLLICVLVVMDQIALWHVLVTAFIQGVFRAVQMPAANTIVYQTVGPQRLLNGTAGRLMAFNLARIVGGVIAGLLLDRSIGSGFLFAALGSFAAIPLLLPMRGSYRSPATGKSFWRVAGEGIKYSWSNAPIRILLLMNVVVELFGFSHMVLLPVIARDVLRVGATGFGYLSTAGGVGAMISTLALAGLGDYKHKGTLLLASAATTGVFLLLFALSPWFWVSLFLVGVVNASLMSYSGTVSTLLQLRSADAMRGRVMGLYGLTFGLNPLGGFLLGAIATITMSAPFALGIGGAITVAYLLPNLRPIRRMQ